MPESRLFYLVYGTDGAEGHRSNFGEMYNVRRGAMGVAVAATKAYRGAGDTEKAEMLEAVRLAFLEMPVGTLMFGYVLRWDNRYIGVIPKGAKIEDAQTVDRIEHTRDAGRMRERHISPISSAPNRPSFPIGAATAVPSSPEPTAAQKIGQRMAKAARAAVENQ